MIIDRQIVGEKRSLLTNEGDCITKCTEDEVRRCDRITKVKKESNYSDFSFLYVRTCVPKYHHILMKESNCVIKILRQND